jgi:hypothetical protein
MEAAHNALEGKNEWTIHNTNICTTFRLPKWLYFL